MMLMFLGMIFEHQASNILTATISSPFIISSRTARLTVFRESSYAIIYSQINENARERI
jgi:hypothetical protein